MQPKLRKVGRIKEKYNPTPTARERAFHLWLMETYLCVCDCGLQSTIVHHPLTEHPEQRWRRDHEFVVPMAAVCHYFLHGMGDEKKWRPDMALDELAYGFREAAIQDGRLGQ